MITPLNTRQRAWLQTATKPEVSAFLAKGDVEVQELHNWGECRNYFRAAIRGVLLEKEFGSPKEAADHGEQYLAELQTNATLPALDEVALGIDGRNTVLADQFEQATVRAETILHLGSMLSDGNAFPDAIDEFLDNFDERQIAALSDELPFLQKLFDHINDGQNTQDNREEFSEMCWKNACFGFLVKFATPVMTPRFKDGEVSGRSFSWGYYRTEWFYGESFEKAAIKALTWAELLRKEEEKNALEGVTK